MKGTIIKMMGFTPSDKNHLTIEILGEGNYIINNVTTGMEVEVNELNKSNVMLSLPSSGQLVEIALLFNDGKIEREKIADMVAMCNFVLNRLKEHNDVTRAASCEKGDGNGA